MQCAFERYHIRRAESEGRRAIFLFATRSSPSAFRLGAWVETPCLFGSHTLSCEVALGTLTLLATIYQTQDELKEVENQFSSILFLPDNMEKGKAYNALRLSEPFINGVVTYEGDLLSIYVTALRRLNPDEYVPAPPND